MCDLVWGFQCSFLSNWFSLCPIMTAVPVYKNFQRFKRPVIPLYWRKHLPVSIQTELLIGLDVTTMKSKIILKVNIGGTHLYTYYTWHVQFKRSNLIRTTKGRPKLFCQYFMVLSLVTINGLRVPVCIGNAFMVPLYLP